MKKKKKDPFGTTTNKRVFGFQENSSALRSICLSFGLCARVKVVGVWYVADFVAFMHLP